MMNPINSHTRRAPLLVRSAWTGLTRPHGSLSHKCLPYLLGFFLIFLRLFWLTTLWDSNPKPLSVNKLIAEKFSVFKTWRLAHGPIESQEQNSEATIPVLCSKNHGHLLEECRYFHTYAFFLLFLIISYLTAFLPT